MAKKKKKEKDSRFRMIDGIKYYDMGDISNMSYMEATAWIKATRDVYGSARVINFRDGKTKVFRPLDYEKYKKDKGLK